MDCRESKNHKRDYMGISHILRWFRKTNIGEGDWHGFLLKSGEFCHALNIGTRKTVLIKSVGTQTDKDFYDSGDETQMDEEFFDVLDERSP